MAYPQVDDDSIIKAGEALEAAGNDVNGWSLRMKLGERGKPKRLLAVWLARRQTDPEPSAPPPPEDLPNDVKEAADGAISAVATAALEIAPIIYRAAKERFSDMYRSQIANLTGEIAKLNQAGEDSVASIEKTDEIRYGLESDLESAKAEVETARRQADVKDAEVAAASRRVEELAADIASMTVRAAGAGRRRPAA